MTHIPIEETDLFKGFEITADELWGMCRSWDHFSRSTIGIQLAKSIDSVGANLVEGDGRFGQADAIHFFVIARGSAREAGVWIRRAAKRGLIAEAPSARLQSQLNSSIRSLNGFINYRRRSGPWEVKESPAKYGGFTDPEWDCGIELDHGN